MRPALTPASQADTRFKLGAYAGQTDGQTEGRTSKTRNAHNKTLSSCEALNLLWDKLLTLTIEHFKWLSICSFFDVILKHKTC